MSTTALHIIQLVKSLPRDEQRAIREALLTQDAVGFSTTSKPVWQRTADGDWINPDGIPEGHPFFQILAEEEEQHRL